MKYGAVIQARMESSRLPGKALMDLGGKPILAHVVDKAKEIAPVFIVTPSSEIVDYAKANGISYSLDRKHRDVLDSYYHCAETYAIENIIRLTADNPLIDPEMVKALIKFYEQGKYDWAANCRLKTTYQVGNDAEVFSSKSLEKAWCSTVDPYESEHVTPYIYRHPEIFKLGIMESPVDLSHIRWTIDTIEDLQNVRQLWNK